MIHFNPGDQVRYQLDYHYTGKNEIQKWCTKCTLYCQSGADADTDHDNLLTAEIRLALKKTPKARNKDELEQNRPKVKRESNGV